MRLSSYKLLTGYKAANPKWCEQHVSVKLGHPLPEHVRDRSMDRVACSAGAVTDRDTRFLLGELTVSPGTVSRSIR